MAIEEYLIGYYSTFDYTSCAVAFNCKTMITRLRGFEQNSRSEDSNKIRDQKIQNVRPCAYNFLIAMALNRLLQRLAHLRQLPVGGRRQSHPLASHCLACRHHHLQPDTPSSLLDLQHPQVPSALPQIHLFQQADFYPTSQGCPAQLFQFFLCPPLQIF